VSSAALEPRRLVTALVALVILQRLLELRRSHRHTVALLSKGGREFGCGHYPWMLSLHGVFFLSLLTELWLRLPPWRPGLAVGAGVVFAASAALRLWAMRTLGDRWTTRVIGLPGEPRIVTGPYRFLRHPNYLGVAGELFALPLIHGCWITAGLFAVANGVLLRRRLAVEDVVLARMESP